MPLLQNGLSMREQQKKEISIVSSLCSNVFNFGIVELQNYGIMEYYAIMTSCDTKEQEETGFATVHTRMMKHWLSFMNLMTASNCPINSILTATYATTDCVLGVVW